MVRDITKEVEFYNEFDTDLPWYNNLLFVGPLIECGDAKVLVNNNLYEITVDVNLISRDYLMKGDK